MISERHELLHLSLITRQTNVPPALFSRAILNIIVNGTDNNMPTIPSNHPQNIKDRKDN